MTEVSLLGQPKTYCMSSSANVVISTVQAKLQT